MPPALRKASGIGSGQEANAGVVCFHEPDRVKISMGSYQPEEVAIFYEEFSF